MFIQDYDFLENLILNFDTVTLRKSVRYFSRPFKKVELNDSEGDFIVYLSGDPADSLDKTNCIKAFMYLQARDSVSFKYFQKEYLNSVWGNYPGLNFWVLCHSITKGSNYDLKTYKDVLKRMLKLKKHDASSCKLLAKYYYEQKQFQKALKYLNTAISTYQEQNEYEYYEKECTLLKDKINAKMQEKIKIEK